MDTLPFYNSNNNNSHYNVYGAVIMTQSHCESAPGLCDECRLCAGWPDAPDARRLGL